MDEKRVINSLTSNLSTSSELSTNVDSCRVTFQKLNHKCRENAEYEKEYRARKNAKLDATFIDPIDAIPSISIGEVTSVLSTSKIIPPTTEGSSTDSLGVGFKTPLNRKSPAQYQQEYRARKKVQP